MSVGLVVCACPFLFKVNTQLITLCSLFIVINTYLLYNKKINSMHNVNRISYGTIIFPFSVLILSFFFWDKPISFFISIVTLAIADPIASIVGSRSNDHFKPWRDSKSIQGSLAMFLTTFIVVLFSTDIMARVFSASFYIPLYILLGLAFFTALCSSLSEMISYRGSDNFSIPLITFFAYEIYLINYTHGSLTDLLLWTVISAAIFVLAYRLRSVSMSGAIGGFLIGILIFGSGGWTWITPLVFFFITSSILSKIRRKTDSRRDLLQILANGGLPALLALTYFFFSYELALFAFVGALASATADTWATEIGYFSRKDPFLIIGLKSVKRGTSGAISTLGTLGTVAGSLGLAFSSIMMHYSLKTIVFVAIAGILGSLIDSILGQFLQAKFQSNISGEIVENKNHLNEEYTLVNGVEWIDNNFVNFINTATGALVAALFIFLYG